MTDDNTRDNEYEQLKRRLLTPLSEDELQEIRRDRHSRLFGDIIFAYTDNDAVEDGVLKRLLANDRDTLHRITGNAYHELTEHHRPSYPNYTEEQFMRFYLTELLSLVPFAFKADRHGRYLTTDFDFSVVKYAAGAVEQLWYVPNEIGGVTMMLPDDY